MSPKTALEKLSPPVVIGQRIHVIRQQRVMLDRDLAELYGVKPIALRQQVKRNPGRFPKDFMFRLNKKETASLLSQNVIVKRLGGSLPLAFTEQGVAMLSSVLTSKRAVDVNIAIMRAFVRMRELMSSHQDVLRKSEEMELRYDDQFRAVFDAIRDLMEPPQTPRRSIGFVPTVPASSST